MPNADLWTPAVSPVEMLADEAHVWRARLDCSESERQRLESTLAIDEINRADRFFFARDRQHFVTARGILRRLLAGYLHGSPVKLDFAYHQRGKPYLLSEESHPAIAFNISHSHGLALFAFAPGGELGVDVEHIRKNISRDEIASRYFAPQEVEELQALPAAERPEAFFLGWTRKEAYIKALGGGLQIPLTSFRVSLTPGQPATLESTDSAKWTLHSLSPGDGYAAALVTERRIAKVRLFEWLDS
jgi:4'-phosphopantetheinyl transferase